MNKKISYIQLESEKELVSKLIDIFSATWLPESKWLTLKEKKYFIECIFLNAKGEDLLSQKTVKYFEDHPEYPKKSVYVYRDKLKKKEWIIQTKTGIILHPDFDYKGRRIPNKVTIRIPLKVK